MRNNNSIMFPQRTTFSPVLKTVLFAHVHLRNHAANLIIDYQINKSIGQSKCLFWGYFTNPGFCSNECPAIKYESHF